MADEKSFTQADIDAAIAKNADKIEELTNKYSGALDDLKKAQRELRAKQDVKPEDLAAAEDRADKAEARAAEAEKQVKTLTTERDKAVKALEDESGYTSKLLIQDGLKSALIANGVKDEDFIDALATKFASGAKVVAEGDVRKAMIGDKSVADHVKEWAGSDAGKKFVAAPQNSGGGAPGGKGGEQGKTMTRTAFDALDPGAKMAFSKEGGTLVD